MRPDAPNSRGAGHIGKRVVTVIDEYPARIALHPAHVQVEIAIAIHVGKHWAAVPKIFRCRLRVLQAGCRCDIRKCVVAIIAVEQVRADIPANNEKVDVTVRIVVPGSRASSEHRDHAVVAGSLGIPNREIQP